MFTNTKSKREKIDSFVNHLTVFQRHIGQEITLGKPIFSPLREETKPSFNIYRKEGKYLFKDFAGESGDLYTFLQMLYNIDFKGAVQMVYDEELIGLDVKATFKTKKKKKYSQKPLSMKRTFFVQYKKEEDFSYFKLSKKTLKAYNCYNIKEYSFYKKDGDICRITERKDKPLYAFAYNSETYKLYNPLSKSLRHIGNTGEKDIFGKWLYDPKKPTFICAGQKDTMMMYELFGHFANCISFNSESTVDVDFLKRIEEGYIIYDVDQAGRKYSEKLNNINESLLNIDLYSFESYIQSKKINDKTKDVYDITTSEEEIKKLYKREINEVVYISRKNRGYFNSKEKS